MPLFEKTAIITNKVAVAQSEEIETILTSINQKLMSQVNFDFGFEPSYYSLRWQNSKQTHNRSSEFSGSCSISMIPTISTTESKQYEEVHVI